MMLFEFKIKRNVETEKVDGTKEMKDGVFYKLVKEHYITEAETFTECEALGDQLSNNGEVFAIFRSQIREIINGKTEGDTAYKAKVTDYFEIDGKEKKMTYYMLVFAQNVQEASERVLSMLEQGYNMQLEGLQATKIKEYLTSANVVL